MPENQQFLDQQAQLQEDPLSFKEDFIAGSISGFANCVSGYVFDTLKVKVQMDPSKTMFDYIKMMHAEGRILHLFDGMYYPLVTVPIVNSIVFGSYQFYKKITGKKQLSLLDGVQNGAFAGLVNTIIVTPVQLIKCRLQLQTKAYKNSQQCFKWIIKNQGIKGLYRGNMATIFRQVPAYGSQFATYQLLKSSLTNQKHPKLEFAESMVVGGLAGIMCWLASYPQDIIKTKLQVEPGKYVTKFYDGGFFDCGKKIYNGNWRNLFAGLQPCLVRAVVANSFGFAAYEKCQNFFQRHHLQ